MVRGFVSSPSPLHARCDARMCHAGQLREELALGRMTAVYAQISNGNPQLWGRRLKIKRYLNPLHIVLRKDPS